MPNHDDIQRGNIVLMKEEGWSLIRLYVEFIRKIGLLQHDGRRLHNGLPPTFEPDCCLGNVGLPPLVLEHLQQLGTGLGICIIDETVLDTEQSISS